MDTHWNPWDPKFLGIIQVLQQKNNYQTTISLPTKTPWESCHAEQIRSRQASCPMPPLVEFGVPFKFNVNSIFWSLIVLYHLSDATCWMPFWFAAREAQSYTAEVEQSGCSRDIWFSGGWNMLELLSHTVPALFATHRDCATQPGPLTYGVMYLNPYITHRCLKLQRFRTSRCVIFLCYALHWIEKAQFAVRSFGIFKRAD